MSKVVINGIKTEKFNQVNGDINYAVNGLNRNDVEKLISNLYEEHASVSVEENKNLLIHHNYTDNKYYGYIKCRGQG